MADAFRHLSLLGGCFLLFLHSTLLGQAPASSKERLSFTVFALGESPTWNSLYYLRGPKEAVKLTFRGNNRSLPVTVASGAKPLIFGVEQLDAVTQQKIYVPVAEAKWPEAASTVLCVFAGVAGNASSVRVMAVDDGLKVFPLRSVRVFNATGVPLLGRIAGFEGNLSAGFSPGYSYPVSSDDPNRIGSFPLAFAAKDERGESKLLYSAYGEAWPFGRSLVFVLPAPQSGPAAVQVRILVDAPPAAPKAKPAL